MTVQPQASKERRRTPRRDAHLIVHFEPWGRAAAARRMSRTADTGLGGMFIATRRPPAKGTRLFVEAFLDVSSEPAIGFEGVVRWRRRFLQPRGMGVEVVAASAADLERLGSWLAAVEPPRRPAELGRAA